MILEINKDGSYSLQGSEKAVDWCRAPLESQIYEFVSNYIESNVHRRLAMSLPGLYTPTCVRCFPVQKACFFDSTVPSSRSWRSHKADPMDKPGSLPSTFAFTNRIYLRAPTTYCCFWPPFLIRSLAEYEKINKAFMDSHFVPNYVDPGVVDVAQDVLSTNVLTTPL